MVLGDVGFVYHALVIQKWSDVWGYVCKLMEVVGEAANRQDAMSSSV
jgi:hypothetical protein